MAKKGQVEVIKFGFWKSTVELGGMGAAVVEPCKLRIRKDFENKFNTLRPPKGAADRKTPAA